LEGEVVMKSRARSVFFQTMNLPRLLCMSLLATFSMAQEPALPPEMQFAPLPAAIPDPADNPGSPGKITLGRLLFFDPILSSNQKIACATCHQPARGWTDGRTIAVGVEALKRNTLTILNVGFNTNGTMFWDNREQGLEAQSMHPIRSHDEMRGDGPAEREALDIAVKRVRAVPAYRESFQATFQGEATAQRLAQAIAAFERSLVTAGTPFDRFLRGDRSALNTQQQRGMKAFTDAGCQHCHGGPMLSDFKLHVIAAPGERQAFRTPSLRNLPHTAPYMHNGSLRTLDDTLLFYEVLMDEVSETLEGGDTAAHPPLDPLLKHLDLKAEDFADLKAFFESLSDPHYDRSAPEHVPSGLKPGGN
jgi:cytochrome c peroxidase